MKVSSAHEVAGMVLTPLSRSDPLTRYVCCEWEKAGKRTLDSLWNQPPSALEKWGQKCLLLLNPN